MLKQYLLCITLAVGGSMAGFFPEDNSSVKWEHAVNSKANLTKALQSDALMLEADVSLNSSNVPIMAHPPATTSDLTLDEFLKIVLHANSKKGVKLDFKTTLAFNSSISVLTQYIESYRNNSIPIWLNADIVQGPGGKQPAVEAKIFLDGAKQFDCCTLSLGWTTNWTGSEYYNSTDIQRMKENIGNADLKQPVTFAVRAAVVSKSEVKVIKDLVAIKNSTLTLWSSPNDKNFTFSNLRKVVDDIGRKHVFIDLPSDQMKAFNSGTKAVLSSASVMLAVGAYAIRFW